MLEDFAKVFLALFFIMDPFASIPVFLAITKKAVVPIFFQKSNHINQITIV